MKTTPKRVLILASAALCITAITATLPYSPKRDVVIEVEGPPNRNFDAVFIVDGRRQTQTVTLPSTFQFFQARFVSYRVTPSHKAAENVITGRIYTTDGWCDGSCEGWSVGGMISCPNVLGFWSRGFGIMTYRKDDPGPDVTHALQ